MEDGLLCKNTVVLRDVPYLSVVHLCLRKAQWPIASPQHNSSERPNKRMTKRHGTQKHMTTKWKWHLPAFFILTTPIQCNTLYRQIMQLIVKVDTRPSTLGSTGHEQGKETWKQLYSQQERTAGPPKHDQWQSLQDPRHLKEGWVVRSEKQAQAFHGILHWSAH
jgi:hypothetical protein